MIGYQCEYVREFFERWEINLLLIQFSKGNEILSIDHSIILYTSCSKSGRYHPLWLAIGSKKAVRKSVWCGRGVGGTEASAPRELVGWTAGAFRKPGGAALRNFWIFFKEESAFFFKKEEDEGRVRFTPVLSKAQKMPSIERGFRAVTRLLYMQRGRLKK